MAVVLRAGRAGGFFACWAGALLLGCASSAGAATGSGTAAGKAWGERVAASAAWHLEHQRSSGRRDCSGLVEAILARAGRPSAGNTRTFWHDARSSGRVRAKPRPGDLVFFDRTWDSNRNGRVDDLLTHIAVVMRVEPQGTVVMVHYGSGRIRALRMHLGRPHVHRDQGEILNDYLRSPSYGRPTAPRLAGELFRGFARPPVPRPSR